jgi:hypothetical protein
MRSLAVLVLALAAVMGVMGCGGAREAASPAYAGGAAQPAYAEAAPGMPAPEEAPSPPPPPGVSSSAGGSTGGRELLAANDVSTLKAEPAPPKAVADAHSATMLVYTASLGMAVYQVDPGLDGVEKIARDLGGYLSSRQDAAVTVRVPRDQFDVAVARIEKLGDVTHRDIKAQDVTDEFVDVSARLKNAYAMRDRLTDLLSRAAAKDALDIEKELGRVTEEIERMEGRLKLLRDQIAFSTITVTFTALAAQTVHDSSLLAPFPWLQQLGLGALLDVR